jgi:hypothetical protein
MFKNTIYLLFALSAAFTTFAAPTAIAAGELVKKDAVSHSYFVLRSDIDG